MIDVFIYHIHLVALVVTFSKYWKLDGLKAGLMSVLLALLVFLICWTLSATFSYYVYPEELNSIFFSNNTLSLILVLIPEYFYYKNFVFNK